MTLTCLQGIVWATGAAKERDSARPRAVDADGRGEVLLRHFLSVWEGEAKHNALLDPR